MRAEVGDKVLIKRGPHAASRGIVVRLDNSRLVVQVGDDLVLAIAADLTNYSLAARKAWRSMPKKAGRPVGSGKGKRMISLRLDPDVLEMLSEAAARGVVANRSSAINSWLRERLREELRRSQDPMHAPTSSQRLRQPKTRRR